MAEPNHPWNPLPVEAMGDEDSDVLFAAIGRALSAWETMEGLLARVFASLCRAEFDGAVRAYGVVSSSSGRLDMLTEALESFPNRRVGEIANLPSLIKRIGRFGGRRNEIAHGVVWHFSADAKSLGHYLVPAMYNSRKRLSYEAFIAMRPMTTDLPWHAALKYAYNSSQVDYFRAQFTFLAIEVLAVADALGKLEAEAFEKKLGDDPGA